MPLYRRALSTSIVSQLQAGRVALLAATLAGAAASLTGCGSYTHALDPAAAAPVASPSAVKSGPQLGYIWSDRDHTLRPVLGIPGATQLGQSVVTQDVYVAAAASGMSNLAILQESDGALDTMTLPTGTPTRLAAVLAPGVTLRFAPSGRSAIAFVPGANTVTLLTGLLATPAVATVPFNLAVSDAVVSDAGSIAAALVGSSGTIVRSVTASGTANPAGAVAALGGMSFVGATDDLLLADAAANSLTLVHNSTSAPSPTLLESASLLHVPLGVGVSHDGHWAVLANTGDSNVVRVDLTARTAPQSFSCFCQPAVVAQLSASSVFRLTTADTGPAWIFDAAAAAPRLLFIPAAAAQKAGPN